MGSWPHGAQGKGLPRQGRSSPQEPALAVGLQRLKHPWQLFRWLSCSVFYDQSLAYSQLLPLGLITAGIIVLEIINTYLMPRMPSDLIGAFHILFPGREKTMEKVNSASCFHGLFSLTDFYSKHSEALHGITKMSRATHLMDLYILQSPAS